MSDLSDDDLNDLATRPDYAESLTVPAVAEIRRHRAAVRADADRIVGVMSNIGADVCRRLNPQFQELAMRVVALVMRRSVDALAVSRPAESAAAVSSPSPPPPAIPAPSSPPPDPALSLVDMVALGSLGERLIDHLTSDELELLVRLSAPAVALLESPPDPDPPARGDGGGSA